ncbi:MAG: nuclear transport factor 2 family protein [Erysipelotrichaceae bacterium]|nr:nuclear transport factor 2 family protein [Erysipelotrichaceae bacterium]
MNGKIVIEMQNAFGRFIQLYHLNRLDLATDLFAKNGHLWLPDRNIDASGTEAIKKALKQMQEERIALGSQRDIHMPHTPAYDTIENDTVGVASWDLHSFEFDSQDKVVYVYARIDAKYIEEDGKWRFLELDWWDVEAFTPWDYDVNADDGKWQDLSGFCLPPAYEGDTTCRDFYQIQNTLARYSHNNRKYAMEDTFANREDISYRALPLTPDFVTGRKAIEEELKRLNRMEEENIGKYVYVPATGGPVIEVKGEKAHAQWMASIYTFEGEAFGIKELPYRFIRRIGLWNTVFVKENGEWKLKDSDIQILFRVPEIDYDSFCALENASNEKWYQRQGLSENRWKPAMPKMGGDFPDELPFFETFLARWVSSYKRGVIYEFIQDNCLNDEREMIFLSRKGRSPLTLVGTDLVLGYFSKGVFRYHHQQITNHGGMSPDVQISTDGRFATLNLFDMNSTAYDPKRTNETTIDISSDWNQENSGYEHTPCRYQLSVYELSFAKVDGVWKLIKVDWETVGSLPNIYLEGKKSRGWAGSKSQQRYPALFEKYEYCKERKE